MKPKRVLKAYGGSFEDGRRQVRVMISVPKVKVTGMWEVLLYSRIDSVCAAAAM